MLDRILAELYNSRVMNYPNLYKDLYKKERYTSIQEAQAGLTKVLKVAEKNDNFYKVMRNNKPIGVLLPIKAWENLLKDIEELKTTDFLKDFEKSSKSKKPLL